MKVSISSQQTHHSLAPGQEWKPRRILYKTSKLKVSVTYHGENKEMRFPRFSDVSDGKY